MIKHIWFDFSDTIASIDKVAQKKARYAAYAEVVKKPISPQLIEEYEEIFRKHHNSNAAVFSSLGLSSNYWSEVLSKAGLDKTYVLTEKDVPEVFDKLRKKVKISIFSNIEAEKILPSLGINPSWFTHLLNAGQVSKPKPDLEGFHKMVELSSINPSEILYIGDNVGKDILPAKQVSVKTGLIFAKSNEADYSFEKFEDILKIL